MTTFKVTRERAYWVRETMLIVARNEERAEATFFDQFTPELDVLGVFDDHSTWRDRGIQIAPVRKRKPRGGR